MMAGFPATLRLAQAPASATSPGQGPGKGRALQCFFLGKMRRVWGLTSPGADEDWGRTVSESAATIHRQIFVLKEDFPRLGFPS